MTQSISQQRNRSDSRNDSMFRWMVTLAGFFVFTTLFAAAIMMFRGGYETFSAFGFKFLYSANWDIVQRQFGALVPIYGTVVTALIAMLIAVPVSFGIAIFLTEVAPSWLRCPVVLRHRTAGRHPVDHLRHVGPVRAGAVAGRARLSLGSTNTWATGRCSARCSTARRSASACGTAGLVLAIMVIPFISSVMREVFLTVPTRLKESAYALGSTTGKWSGTSSCPTPAQRSSAASSSASAARWARPWRLPS